MKTSAILQRVVDFLGAYPPFSQMDAVALAALAGRGKVLFREQDDLIFEEGEQRGRFLYVVQTGGVRLIKSQDGEDILMDLRGPGEIFGLGSLPPSGTYPVTARALVDTILYALDLEEFLKVCDANRQAAESLSVLLADGPEKSHPGEGSRINWLRQVRPLQADKTTHGLLCPMQTTLRDVVDKMVQVDDGAIVLTGPRGEPAGICTQSDILGCLAAGKWDAEATAREIMRSPVITTPPTASVGENLLLMMRHGIGHLCVTEDGLPTSRALGILSERDIMIWYGNNPLVLLKAIRTARSEAELGELRSRAEVLVGRALLGWEDVEWLLEVVAEVDRAVIQRLSELLAEDHGCPHDVLWLLTGSAGRREHLIRSGLGVSALVPSSSMETVSWNPASALQEGLKKCGYHWNPNEPPATSLVTDIGKWKDLFRQWIARPVESGITDLLAIFDLDPLCSGAADELRSFIKGELEGATYFVPLIANDCLAHLPPLTLFEGRAVDESGRIIGRPDIKTHALRAATDAARALTLEFGDLETRSTPARLQMAAHRIPEAAELLNNAARATKVALFLRARLRLGGDQEAGKLLDLTHQAMLKFSFRTIASLLRFVVARYGVGKA